MRSGTERVSHPSVLSRWISSQNGSDVVQTRGAISGGLWSATAATARGGRVNCPCPAERGIRVIGLRPPAESERRFGVGQLPSFAGDAYLVRIRSAGSVATGMARGTPISRAGALTSSSRSPSPRLLTRGVPDEAESPSTGRALGPARRTPCPKGNGGGPKQSRGTRTRRREKANGTN